jgi:ADP-heptose:LPS heptosyltransferase
MNLRFQRALDCYLGVPICAILSLLDLLIPRQVEAKPYRRILVILLSEMGSLVLAYPMFARLKQQYPEASLHVLLFAKNREVLDLLGVIPEENVFTLDDHSLIKFITDSFRVIRKLRALHFDVVVDCELFARISSMLSYFSAAPLRVGFHRHTQEGLYRGSFINRRVLYNPYRHLSEQFLTLVAAIGSGTVPLAKQVLTHEVAMPPPVAFSATELQQFAVQLHADFPAIRGKRLVLIYPSGGVLPIRAWPLDHYCQLSAGLLRDGCAVAIIGLAEHKPLAQAVQAHCKSELCIDLTSYTKSVRHLLALFHCAALLITNDGGPAQFAALTPIRMIVMFGPETPVLYRSLSRNAYSFYTPIACSPCLTAYNHRTSPCDGDNRCLKQITPEHVLVKARELLGADPAVA